MTKIYTLIAKVVGFFGVLFAFFLMGKKSESANQKIEKLETNAKAAKEAKDTRNEMESQDDQHIIDILTGKLRDKR